MFTKSVDGIVKSLTNMVKELEVVVNRERGIQQRAEIEALAAEGEAFRAANIMTKLQGLLS